MGRRGRPMGRRRTNKSPAHWPGPLFQSCPCSELPAQAAADDIDSGFGVKIILREVVVQILSPQEHVVHKLVLKPGTGGPTKFVGVGRVTECIAYMDMTPTGARGAVGEQVREEDVADPGTC